MIENLSSASTRASKLILPIVWIACFGFGTIGLWIGIFEPTPPVEMKYFFSLAWIVGSVFFIWGANRIKTVAINGDDLVIKNFRKSISVPLRNVKSISETHLVNPKTIKLTFSQATEFGQTVVFIPKKILHNPFKEHPTVKRLRELTNLPV
jgi:hypothetical protein